MSDEIENVSSKDSLRTALTAAAFVFAMIATAAVTWNVAERNADQRVITSDILADHQKALLEGHLTDVASTDEHTVKPWFNGRVDFAPPVKDFAAKDFPLVGARIDYVHGHQAAVLVYGRRKHMISFFIWPEGRGSQATASRTILGFNIRSWTQDGFVLTAISDLNPYELDNLVSLYRESL